MKVSKSSALGMFEAMGFTVNAWAPAKLVRKLNSLEAGADGSENLEGDNETLFKSVLNALGENETIEIEQENADVDETKTTKKGKKSKGAAAGDKRGRKPSGAMSCVEAAYKVLKESKKALSAKDICEKAAAKGYWSSPDGKTPTATVAARIYTEIQKKGNESRFVKAERGLFAVKK